MKNKFLLPISMIAVLALTSCKNKNPTQPTDPIDPDEPETVIIKPENVEIPEGCFHTKEQLAYILSSYDTVNTFADGSIERSKPAGNIIKFTKTGGVVLQVSSFEDFHEDSDTPFLETRLFDIEGHDSAKVKNLFSDTNYYWRTFASTDLTSDPLETGTFKTCNHLPRLIDIENASATKYVTNVRDMGGYDTYLEGYSKVKQGYIYRSGRMSGSTNAKRSENTPMQKPVTDTGKPGTNMSTAGYNTLMITLGMKGEIDLRNDTCKENDDGGDYYVENGNRDKYPDIIPGINCLAAGIYAEKSALLQDIPGMDSGYRQIKQVFDFYSQPANYPNFVHCYIGTDRTGCICYLLECLLGLSNEVMYKDYLWSNFGLINGTRTLDAIKTYERKLRSYNKPTMAENCEAFLTSDTIGISHEQIKTIRDLLLEKA